MFLEPNDFLGFPPQMTNSPPESTVPGLIAIALVDFPQDG